MKRAPDKRPTAVLVVLLKPGTTMGELVDLAEILKFHRVVQHTRLELAPGVAKTLPRSVHAAARRSAR